jgi:hypothetical protein
MSKIIDIMFKKIFSTSCYINNIQKKVQKQKMRIKEPLSKKNVKQNYQLRKRDKRETTNDKKQELLQTFL